MGVATLLRYGKHCTWQGAATFVSIQACATYCHRSQPHSMKCNACSLTHAPVAELQQLPGPA